MPTPLPTITVTDPQAARILEAFKALYGTTTQQETVAAYKKWLTREVRSVVVAQEAKTIDAANYESRRMSLLLLQESLPDPEAAGGAQ